MAKLKLSIGKKSWSMDANAQQSLLDLALSSGVPINYSCKRGDCGQCVGVLLAGAVLPMDAGRPLLSDDRIYLCNAVAKGDVEIELPHFPELDGIPLVRSACKIQELTALSADVLQVSFRLPPRTPFDFVPGQYLRVTNKDRITRSYSLANAPRPDNLLFIHVRRVEGGIFSRYLFETAKPGDLLHLEGPMGQFVIRADVIVEKTLFLATGTGIAPVHAMLSSMSEEQRGRCGKLYAYWGNYRPSDAYLDSGMIEHGKRMGLSYFPLFSRGVDLDVAGRARHVQELMTLHHPDLSAAQVFAAGNSRMIEEARKRAVDSHLPSSKFFSDAFTAS
jgi:CDP-4-dehydro-6-deoxyglucose reductase